MSVCLGIFFFMEDTYESAFVLENYTISKNINSIFNFRMIHVERFPGI
jgi:hypothetical protein